MDYKLAAEYYEKDTVSTTELYVHVLFPADGKNDCVFIIGILGTRLSFICRTASWIRNQFCSRNPAGDCMDYREMKDLSPTRHYSQDEMMISMAASMLGFSIASDYTDR